MWKLCKVVGEQIANLLPVWSHFFLFSPGTKAALGILTHFFQTHTHTFSPNKLFDELHVLFSVLLFLFAIFSAPNTIGLHFFASTLSLSLSHPFPAKGFLLFCKRLNRPRQCDLHIVLSLCLYVCVWRSGCNYINSFYFFYVVMEKTGNACVRLLSVLLFFRFVLQKWEISK